LGCGGFDVIYGNKGFVVCQSIFSSSEDVVVERPCRGLVFSWERQLISSLIHQRGPEGRCFRVHVSHRTTAVFRRFIYWPIDGVVLVADVGSGLVFMWGTHFALEHKAFFIHPRKMKITCFPWAFVLLRARTTNQFPAE
jgi:hypothetical protein